MQNNTSYRTIVLSALLIGIFLPLVCGLTVYAAQLEVSSPYFNFRIGPPLVDSGSASPNPNQSTDVNSDAVSTSQGTCLLNVVCINPIVKDDSSAGGEGLDLDADVSVEAAGEDSVDLDLSVDVGGDAGVDIGVGPGDGDGLDLDVDVDDSGAEVDLDVGDDIGLDLDLDLDDDIDLDLDLGLP